jgi:uncharacterized membrane protein
MKVTSILQMTVRIAGVIELILGILFWTGNAESLVICHIALGSLITLALFVLTYQAYRANVSRWLVLIAAVWAIGLPIWGLAQGRIFPGTYNWISEVLHLLCGVGAIGVAEILAAQIRKKA